MAGIYRAAIAASSLPLAIITVQGRFLFANKGFERFCGYPPRELADITLRELCAPYERDRYFFSHLDQLAETIELDIDLKVRGGSSITSSVVFAPFECGGCAHVLLVFRDVTGKRLQEGRLRDSEERYRRLLAERDELEAQLKRSIKLACLGELAAGIAHEINNPLGIILGFAQDMLDEIDSHHPLWESAKIIEHETARCADVVHNLLDLARLKPPQIMELDLARLIEETLTLVAPEARNKSIQLQCELDPAVPLIRADPQQLQQALLNLLINAVQAMPLGGELIVTLKLTQAEQAHGPLEQVQIAVSDTGQGISQANLRSIFDPFFSTKGSKGTGLGLAICQRIVEDHRGRIAVASQEGLGTTFTLFLPIPESSG